MAELRRHTWLLAFIAALFVLSILIQVGVFS